MSHHNTMDRTRFKRLVACEDEKRNKECFRLVKAVLFLQVTRRPVCMGVVIQKALSGAWGEASTMLLLLPSVTLPEARFVGVIGTSTQQ